jgi:hypothetical protein
MKKREMLRKNVLAGVVILCLLLPVFFSCEPDPAEKELLPTDNYVPVANSFNGVWKDAEDTYWKFNTDGTGGKATTAAGPFENDEFGFLVFTHPTTSVNTLVMLSGEPVTVTRYILEIEDNQASLTLYSNSESVITFDWVSGRAAPLSLTNVLIGGEIAAVWNAQSTLNGSWSIKFRADGSVQHYHHQMNHQFNNSYALWKNTLVIFGTGGRFTSPVVGTLASTITSTSNKDTWTLQESSIKWIYTKVPGVKWKEGDVVQPAADTYAHMANPFNGVWKEAEDSYWEFRTDGTGGYATTATGEFSDEFSFVVTASSGNTTSLVMLDDDGADTRYTYVIEDDTATLTLSGTSESKVLTKESGEPQILSLSNQLIGELAALWNPATTLNGSWSIKFRTDGSVQLYHHQMGMQFNNGYVLRGNTLAIFGTGGRFTQKPVVGTLASKNSDTWTLQELEGKGGSNGVFSWLYTQVSAAPWR